MPSRLLTSAPSSRSRKGQSFTASQAWKRRGTRTSDRYLFYADGTPAFGYLLITLINDPGAHQVWQPQYTDFVEMIERIADDFHHHGKTPD